MKLYFYKLINITDTNFFLYIYLKSEFLSYKNEAYARVPRRRLFACSLKTGQVPVCSVMERLNHTKW